MVWLLYYVSILSMLLLSMPERLGQNLLYRIKGSSQAREAPTGGQS